MGKQRLHGLLVAQIPRLRRYARALTTNQDQADDLVQDCLERAWSRRDRWQPDSDLRAWTYTIMHNLHVNKLRYQRQHRVAEWTGEGEYRDPRPSAQDQAMDLHDLDRGLAGLLPEQREVLLLVCVEDMSYRQVGEVLGLPIGTVMSRLHRAREHFAPVGGW